MKTEKALKSKPFPESLKQHWENNDGVDFAIALARLTGWMLQVDWLTGHEHAEIKDMIPVRVYVETNRDIVFDFMGKKSVMAYNQHIIRKIAMKRVKGDKQHIATRCYTEEALRELPLRVRASEHGIEKATAAILANRDFLALIPVRQNPYISGHDASQFSHGNCVPYAEALHDLTGLTPLGIEVSKYSQDCGSKLGFCHAVILHADGNVEDSWGTQPLSVILERFYIEEYQINEQIFLDAKQRQRRDYSDRYQAAYDKALYLLKEHRLNTAE
ncbi:hypothetical protein [Pedobacter sp. GR22-6]|uniref:hypothetical protein n=1 Tax=Pedobacter sp. GR22-6 TaxID=3127957 RepID=UPI00307F93DE